MSDPVTVPMFDPSGTLRDIPYEKMREAYQHGAKPGVRMQAPDGTVRVVPADRYVEAYQHGAKVLPIQEQAVDHPGFWSAVAQDAVGVLHGAAAQIGNLGALFEPGNPRVLAAPASAVQADQSRKAAGNSPAYRATAMAATGVGVNTTGMEESANRGDTAGVLGHTVVPAALATAPLVTEGAIRGGKAIAANDTVARVGRTGAEVAKVPLKFADVMAFKRLSAMYEAGKEALGNIGEIWNKPQPTNPGAPYPANPLPEQINPAVASPARSLPGQIGPERIYGPRPTPAQPIPPRQQLALPGNVQPPVQQPVAPPVTNWTPPEPPMNFQPRTFARTRAEMIDDQAVAEQARQRADVEMNALRAEGTRKNWAANTRQTPKGVQIEEAGGKLPQRPVKYTPTPSASGQGYILKAPIDDLTQILQDSLESEMAKRGK